MNTTTTPETIIKAMKLNHFSLQALDLSWSIFSYNQEEDNFTLRTKMNNTSTIIDETEFKKYLIKYIENDIELYYKDFSWKTHLV